MPTKSGHDLLDHLVEVNPCFAAARQWARRRVYIRSLPDSGCRVPRHGACGLGKPPIYSESAHHLRWRGAANAPADGEGPEPGG